MRSWMIALSSGIAVTGLLPTLPVVSFAILLSMFLVAVLLFSLLLYFSSLPGYSDKTVAIGIAQICLCFMLGNCWGLLYGRYMMDTQLPENLEGVDFWLVGEVDSLPRYNGRAQQFEVRVTGSCLALHPGSCAANEQALRLRRVLLNYYGGEEILPGQYWRLRVRLNRPHGFVNPGGFDYELMLAQNGINAKGYVRDTEFNIYLGESRYNYQRLRYQLRERLLVATAEMQYAGIILALVLGERDLISSQSWELFSQTGTNHLIVISGLHVGFVALVVYWLVNISVRLLPGLLLFFPAQKIAAGAAVLGAFVYSLLAGFSMPTQRALIMLAVFMLAQVFARNFPATFSYCLALTLVLLLAPLSAMSAGFWLSFVAVGGLLLAFTGWQQMTSQSALRSRLQWSVWGRPQWVVFVVLSVPLAFWMQQMSLLSPLANIFAIPLVSLLVVPLGLAGMLGTLLYAPAGILLLHAADFLLAVLTGSLTWLVADFSGFGVWKFYGLQPWAFFCAAVGSFLLLLPTGWPARYLGLVLFLPLFRPVGPALPEQGEVWVNFLDVGQGLAVVVRTNSHTLLYDTGPRFSDSFDTGRGVILPFLQKSGVRQLDSIIVSHSDNDHAGGLDSVLSGMPVGQIMSGTPLNLTTQNSVSHAFSRCARGMHWYWDNVEFEILHPGDQSYQRRNNNSCVLQIRAAGVRILLTGDIEAHVEAELLGNYTDTLASDILLAPHHGSNSSSTPAFIAAVNPEFVVYSAGYRNQFGHPSAEVRQRYLVNGALALNTARSGMIEFRQGAEEGIMAANVEAAYTPREYRESRRRYWFVE